MEKLIFLLLLFGNPERPVAEVGQCEPVGGHYTWTQEARHETRSRAQAACEAVGASDAICAFVDAVVVRESSGRSGVRHTKGRNENGLGAMGLSLRWHRDKWPGKDEDPMFCQPEVSFIVAHAIMWRAVTRYHARSLLEVQAIYAGQWECFRDPETDTRRCFANPTMRTVKSICGRLKMRGHDCHAPIDKSDLGKRIPFRERRAWAERVAEAWTIDRES